jgi:hypothetical protein
MPTIRFTVSSPASCSDIAAALTDFSPRRPQVWRNLDPTSYRVHAQGETWVDVTEGVSKAGSFWERSRYDWSQPNLVRTTLIDSNVLAAGSFWQYELRPTPGGGTEVTCTVHRLGKNLRGRILVTLIGIVGPRVIRRDLELMLAQLEAH